MIKLIVTYIMSLIKPTDIIIKLNGSEIKFKKEGDIEIKAGRNFINNSKYNFINCTEEEIKEILYRREECLEQLEEETL